MIADNVTAVFGWGPLAANDRSRSNGPEHRDLKKRPGCRMVVVWSPGVRDRFECPRRNGIRYRQTIKLGVESIFSIPSQSMLVQWARAPGKDVENHTRSFKLTTRNIINREKFAKRGHSGQCRRRVGSKHEKDRHGGLTGRKYDLLFT
jgi:hypothetical protein